MQSFPQCFSVSVLFSRDYPVLLTSFAGYRKRLPYLVNATWLWIISRGIWANQKQKCFEWITTIIITTNSSQTTTTFWSVSGFEEWSGASLNQEHGIFYHMFIIRTAGSRILYKNFIFYTPYFLGLMNRIKFTCFLFALAFQLVLGTREFRVR